MTNPNPVAPKTDTPAMAGGEGMMIYATSFSHCPICGQPTALGQLLCGHSPDMWLRDAKDELDEERISGDRLLVKVQQLRKELKVAREDLYQLESTLAAERAERKHELEVLFSGRGIPGEIDDLQKTVVYWVQRANGFEKELAAERASRLQAETEQFNAGIEEAAHWIETHGLVGDSGQGYWIAEYAFPQTSLTILGGGIRALSKPSVSPEQAEETK